MLRLLRRKAQSTAEYAIVIGLVIAAAVAMQVYVKRGLQAKVKDAVDYNPDATVLSGKAYEPDYLTYDTTDPMKSESWTREKSKTEYGGGVTRTITGEGNVSTRTGTQVVDVK